MSSAQGFEVSPLKFGNFEEILMLILRNILSHPTKPSLREIPYYREWSPDLRTQSHVIRFSQIYSEKACYLYRSSSWNKLKSPSIFLTIDLFVVYARHIRCCCCRFFNTLACLFTILCLHFYTILHL